MDFIALQTNFKPNRRRDILLLIFSIIGILGLAGRGIYLGILGFAPLHSASPTDPATNLLDASSMLFCAALLLPLLIYCIRVLKGQNIRPAKIMPIKFRYLAELISAWMLIIILGSLASSLPQPGTAIAIPFFLLGIALPIAGLVWIAMGGIPTGSRRRLWAAFGIGMAGSTVGAMLLEYMLVGIGVAAAGIVAALYPELRTVLQQVLKQVTNGGDVQSLLITLAPYLTNPLVLLLALVFAAVLAPIIEETLKPAAIWLLGKRLHSPAEGFVLGALCGSGFAMLEGMQAASGMTQMLGIGIAARAASSLMHITASGVMGWGIASARLEKRYGRLAGAYLLSVGIHGLWNGSVILAVFGALRFSLQGAGTDIFGMLLVTAGIGILGSMLVAIMIILPIINHRLRRASAQIGEAPHSDIIAPL